MAQLERIKKVIHHFDAVAIIRGGGGDVGLSCYNNYELAKAITLFPIPVITGIGHVTNETVCEMIAHTNAITPTKLAEYLIQKFHNFSVPIQKAKEKIADKSRRLLSEENTKLESELKLFRSLTVSILNTNENRIKNSSYSIRQQSQFIVKNNHEKLNVLQAKTRIATKFNLNQLKVAVRQYQEKVELQPILYLKNFELALENIEKNIQIMDPINVLKRGFSITYSNGKAVKEVSQLEEGAVINTMLFSGTIDSTITKIKNKMEEEMNYTNAFEELQRIVTEIEQGEISVDELSEKVKRATALIKFCKLKLTTTEEDVNAILKELEN